MFFTKNPLRLQLYTFEFIFLVGRWCLNSGLHFHIPRTSPTEFHFIPQFFSFILTSSMRTDRMTHKRSCLLCLMSNCMTYIPSRTETSSVQTIGYEQLVTFS